jgi:hypothetical protein
VASANRLHPRAVTLFETDSCMGWFLRGALDKPVPRMAEANHLGTLA